ncbi:hypothetical protein DERF_000314 [Dermatophagoides farinae]|uniref:Uncharacterized protein n=1 Tax=Dermatophagoides farinae TaxID=6954 RepID=A0A922IBA4_DERFA|nr:hypothetical protein DERF_000314 [Dermatophagoides farinae]
MSRIWPIGHTIHAVPAPNISSNRFSANSCFTSAIGITRSITSISFHERTNSINDCLVTPVRDRDHKAKVPVVILPSLRSPEPPCQARTYFGSASNDTGLKTCTEIWAYWSSNDE